MTWIDPQPIVPGSDASSDQFNDEVLGNLTWLREHGGVAVLPFGHDYSTHGDSGGETNHVMGYAGVSGALASVVFVCPVACTPVAMSVAITNPRTAGSLTFKLRKNGVDTGVQVVINASNTQTNYTTITFGTVSYAAGDTLGIVWSGSSFDPDALQQLVASVLIAFT